VRVVRESGEDIGTITLDEGPTNVAFGDDDRRTLYITAQSGLYRTRLLIPGAP
jgi:gluconolactonase